MKSVVFSVQKLLLLKTAALMIIPIGEQLSERLKAVFSPLQSISPQFFLVQVRSIRFIWFAIFVRASQVELTKLVGVGSEPDRDLASEVIVEAVGVWIG